MATISKDMVMDISPERAPEKSPHSKVLQQIATAMWLNLRVQRRTGRYGSTPPFSHRFMQMCRHRLTDSWFPFMHPPQRWSETGWQPNQLDRDLESLSNLAIRVSFDQAY